MAGALVTLIAAAAIALAAWPFAVRLLPDGETGERIGVAGLLGLGFVGTLTLFVGLIPGGLRWGVVVVVLPLGLYLLPAWRASLSELRFRFQPDALSIAGLVALGTMAFIAVLAPSDARDWDSLAYHLAVPKIWLGQGQIGYIPAIHHSNFPFAVDNLFIWGQLWGGQAGAKAFVWSISAFGLLAVYGVGKRWGATPAAGWGAAVLVAGMPVFAWESGTAYIDAAHGLFAGLGVAYASESLVLGRAKWVVAGLMLGLALGTKLTGLAPLVALGIVGAIVVARHRIPLRGPLVALALAVALGTPWWAKSFAMTGNPVFPFFYSVFGGREWDTWRADTYAGEQATFGPGKSPILLGHAVLGLAYQPGRYVNPGQTEGAGFPSGALGGAVVAAAAFAAALGRLGRRNRIALAMVGVQLGVWFVLSHQSRYLVAIGVPLALVAASTQIRAARWLGFLQAAYTIALLWTTSASGQWAVALGAVPRDAYEAKRVAFADPARVINSLPGTDGVALYDEVFGYFLNRSYFWANPGHSTRINYDALRSGSQLAGALRGIGLGYIYANLQTGMSEDGATRWLTAATGGADLEPSEIERLMSDRNLRWQWLVAEGTQSGAFRVVKVFGRAGGPPRGVLLQIEG